MNSGKKAMPKKKAEKMIRDVIADVTKEVIASAGAIPADWNEQQIRWYVVDVIREKGMFTVSDLKARRDYIRDKKSNGIG